MTVPPTLDLDEAAARVWDVLAIGAGPAGALAAREIARQGLAVLLVDQAAFPRGKVCGCCLNGAALETLRTVGLGSIPERLGAVPLREVRFGTGRTRPVSLPLPAGVAVSRRAFDARLVDAAVAAGATFLPQTWARVGEAGPRCRTVRLRQKDREATAFARLVLAASGLGTPDMPGFRRKVRPASRLGAGVIADEGPACFGAGTIYMACGKGGYVGIVRLEDGRLGVAAALEPTLVRRAGGLGRAAAGILGEVRWPAVPGLADLPWRGTPRLTSRLSRPAGERLFFLGDAAGYVEPFTGEGIAWALAGAAAVAPLALQAVRRWQPSLADRWGARHARTVVHRQGICRVAADVLRRPVLTRGLLGLLNHVPRLAVPVLHRLNAPLVAERESPT